MKRLSIVQLVHNGAVTIGSVFQIGDSKNVTTRSKVLALQRQYELFFENEGELRYPVFTRPIPRLPIDNQLVRINKLNESPIISVHNVRLLSVSTAAVLHIGSTSTVDAEARVKHIRQLSSRIQNNSTSDDSQASIKVQRECSHAFRSRTD